ncbi:hypothetical protein BGZ83_011864 [Gryganskiella cystojenkinii]|nr:hypothetical protein BGZ83_011864 [Gryganskiella cystojenkinii]
MTMLTYNNNNRSSTEKSRRNEITTSSTTTTTNTARSGHPFTSAAAVAASTLNLHSNSSVRSAIARNGTTAMTTSSSKELAPSSVVLHSHSLKQTREMIEEGYEDLDPHDRHKNHSQSHYRTEDANRRSTTTSLGSSNRNGHGFDSSGISSRRSLGLGHGHGHGQGHGHSNGNGTSNSSSNSSSLSRPTTTTSATGTGTLVQVRPGRSQSHSQSHSRSNSQTAPLAGTDADANFRAGLKLIQQAYEERHQALVEEVNHWKWVSEEQSAQMAAMAAQLARVEDDYAALQKEMSQLETFRKAIVSMVDQHSGVSLSALEQSILETIEADGENVDERSVPIADADTSSFMLDEDDDADTLSPLGARQARYIGADHLAKQAPKKTSTSTTKGSPQSSYSRPRASTESLSKTSKDGTDIRHQGMATRGTASLSSSVNRYDNGNLTTVDDSPNGLKKVQKYGSTDSLRMKRNTLTASSRPIYPRTPSAADAKSHSSISPMSPRTRASTSARAVGASTSFSSNSTPSTSPRHPVSGTAGLAAGGSLLNRSGRQQELKQKEYSFNVRSSMSHLATLSGVAPLSSENAAIATAVPQSDRRQSNASLNQSLQMPPSQQHRGISRTGSHRGKRSNSGSTAASSNLSPAAQELIRQQERQQLEEQSHIHKGLSQRDAWHSNHGSRGSTASNFSRSSGHATQRPQQSLQPPQQQSVDEHDYDSGHAPSRHYASGYESSSKHTKDSSATSTKTRQSGSQSAKESTEQRQQQSQGGVDASAFTTLYKEIRDSMDVTSFGMFARVVTAFNEGEKTTDETLQEVGMIVKDQALNQRFQDLIHQAIAEKESQLEDEVGNGTFEGDVTLEIDQSLLMDDEKEFDDQDLNRNDLDDPQDTLAIAPEDEEDDLQAEQYPYDADDSLLRDPSFNDDDIPRGQDDGGHLLSSGQDTSRTAPLQDDEEDEKENDPRPANGQLPRKQTI